MFDPGAGAGARTRGGFGGSAAREADIPPAVAEIEENAGVLALRYSGRRHLGWALVLFVAGAIVTVIGAAMFAAGDTFLGAAAMVVVGVLLDVGAVALLVGRLAVTVRAGEISVEKAGLFGRRAWTVRRDALRELRPVVSYTVNGLPYYSLFAETADGRAPLGTSLKGAEITDAVSRRIARALGAPPSLVVPASSVPIPQTD
jgi:hypothetical protein